MFNIFISTYITDSDSTEFDLGLLIEEMSRLRVLLETTIAKNTELRQKLQEVLNYSPASSLHININHLQQGKPCNWISVIDTNT